MRKGILLAAAVCLGLFISSPAWAVPSSAVKSKSELNQVRQQKGQVQGKIKQLNEKMKANQAELERLEKESYRIDDEILRTQQEIRQINAKLTRQQAIFKQRVRRLYEQGDFGFMRTLLTADSFQAFLTRFETMRLIVKQDRNLFDSYFKWKQAKTRYESSLVQLKAEQKKKAEEAKAAYDRMLADLKKNRVRLAELEGLEDIKEDEVRRINLSLLHSGRLSFPYEGGPLRWPANSHEITSPYGPRVHPLKGVMRPHMGIDIHGNYNDPVYAAAGGVVVRSGPSLGYGWIIVIYHGKKGGQDLFTWYGHSYENQVLVHEGDEVKRGQRISGIGSNGFSTGPHLHFEVRLGEKAVNPVLYLSH
ncbi:peptidoglycan DD-metalloendopeptidase family protein [Polycladomyces sp. WAk]|uniref:Peptidoglycan DD-metalloendopeptidase family protein n=1 Tax=Polycladomyces zharkentensis TaxID=2807616 RepID=A0ABS2WEK5_9BACL|nr:M23 family metallopeptidase [Polycladomyces sp. WAk]MBN2907943.1 peptidoglycan DD-metalloendopeptidase family protein [Polycladomyces sp. WAk]